MPKILREKDGIRLYVRGPIGASRYFISEKTDNTLRRATIAEDFANLLENTHIDLWHVARAFLDTARTTGGEDYFECKL